MKECIVCATKDTLQWYTGPKCKSCYSKEHRKQNPDSYKEREAQYYQENSEKIKERQNKYYQNNRQSCKERSRQHRELVGDQHRDGYYGEWRVNNPGKSGLYCRTYKEKYPERVKKSSKKYVDNNLHKFAERTARRRSAKLQATPSWLTIEQLNEIKKIYENCPPGYHVDHIMPLRGENSCGLHVPWNLQYLPALENLKKGNRIP